MAWYTVLAMFLKEFYQTHHQLVNWSFGISTGLLLAGLAAMPIVIARLPADYFRRQHHAMRPLSRNPLLHHLLRLLRNVGGALLTLVGLVLLLGPGQGTLLILVGLMLMDFKGKHSLVRWLAGRRAIWATLGWLRRITKCTPFDPPEPPRLHL
jgi:hypothetical protein